MQLLKHMGFKIIRQIIIIIIIILLADFIYAPEWIRYIMYRVFNVKLIFYVEYSVHNVLSKYLYKYFPYLYFYTLCNVKQLSL